MHITEQWALLQYTTQHRTVLNFPLILQTIIIAQIWSIGGDVSNTLKTGGRTGKKINHSEQFPAKFFEDFQRRGFAYPTRTGSGAPLAAQFLLYICFNSSPIVIRVHATLQPSYRGTMYQLSVPAKCTDHHITQSLLAWILVPTSCGLRGLTGR